VKPNTTHIIGLLQFVALTTAGYQELLDFKGGISNILLSIASETAEFYNN
jgi:hypothetical protein